MSVITVTLNPALDLRLRVDHFRTNTVNRGQEMAWRAAGKGVNVAACLADQGIPVTATGLLGEENPRCFEDLCRERGIVEAFLRVPGETRTNVAVSDEAAQETTDIHFPGAPPPPGVMAAFHARLATLAPAYDTFVLAGSLPPGVPVGFYADLTRALRAPGRTVGVDTSGPALTAAFAAAPTFVKPNLSELEGALGRRLPTEADALAAARDLVARGIELVVVSMGERGALFVTAKQALIARAPKVSVRTTVGAGDAMVAGIVAARRAGRSLERTAQLATAFSVAAITRTSPKLPSPAELDAVAERVRVDAVAGLAGVAGVG